MYLDCQIVSSLSLFLGRGNISHLLPQPHHIGDTGAPRLPYMSRIHS